MYQKILNFVKYNNAFTIIFIIVFFGFGVSFAASPIVRDGIYSSSETVTSIDNQLLISTDLDNFDFNSKISSITDDDRNYYVSYSYQTLAIEDSVWQNKTVEKTLTVNKEFLGNRDLGLYVAKELGDNINYESSYLKKVQALQKEKGVSQKVVTVEYSGLIGKLLNPREKVIEGYQPVIPEVVETPPQSEPDSTPVVPETIPVVTPPVSDSTPTPVPLTCTLPEVLDTTTNTCITLPTDSIPVVTPPVSDSTPTPVPLTCTLPEVLDTTTNTCITPPTDSTPVVTPPASDSTPTP
jgi:hypothetical protein